MKMCSQGFRNTEVLCPKHPQPNITLKKIVFLMLVYKLLFFIFCNF